MSEKVKSLSLSKLKIAEAEVSEGKTERRILFVASTPNEDRDHEVIDIATFRLPTKGGGYIKVADLPAGGADNIDVPLLTNHDLWNVEKTIGSVRRASFEDGKLIFETGISSRPYAQDVFKLVEEGHLDNAFSIQYSDYEHDPSTRTDRNGEIYEVSLVTRGSNRDAQVLAVKQVKGEIVDNDKTTNTVGAPESQGETLPQAPEADGLKQNQADPSNEEQAEEKAAEPADEKEEAQPQETTNEENKMDTETNHTELAAKQVKMPSQAATSAKTATNDYLKSKGAVLDYAKLAKKCGGDAETTNQMWKDRLAAKGITITGEDSFLPTRVEQVMFKAWHDAVGALKTFRRTSAKAFKFYAMTTSSTALGHKKGEQKANQDIVAIPRNGGLKTIYKKLPIDWIDIVNDESGELYVFRTRELTDRVLHAIVEGAILGDGLSTPAEGKPDYRVFDGVNGLYSIVGDLNASATTGSYASAVATVVANVAADDTYAKIVKTLEEIDLEDGEKAVLVLPKGSLAEMRLLKNENGGYLYNMGTNFADIFGVSYIVEFPAAKMTAAGYDVIAYKDQGYTLGGPDATVRNWFDGNVNQDVMMVEQPVMGSLEGNKVAAGYASK